MQIHRPIAGYHKQHMRRLLFPWMGKNIAIKNKSWTQHWLQPSLINLIFSSLGGRAARTIEFLSKLWVIHSKPTDQNSTCNDELARMRRLKHHWPCAKVDRGHEEREAEENYFLSKSIFLLASLALWMKAAANKQNVRLITKKYALGHKDSSFWLIIVS